MTHLDAHLEWPAPGETRSDIDGVFALPGVVTVLDAENERVVDHRGLEAADTLEVLAHFTGTWWELLNALLPVLSDALGESWTPGRWWACAGGERIAVGRFGRAVVATRDAAGPFLAAVTGDGHVEGTRVW